MTKEKTIPKMKEFKVILTLKMEYNAYSEEEVKEMVNQEYGLGDVENDLFIEEKRSVSE